MNSAGSLYSSVILDVINNVRDDFLDEGAEERALMELKSLWEAKLKASKTIDSPSPPQPQIPNPQSQSVSQQSGGASAVHGQQLLVTDPSRLMPVQITIPAQPNQPNSGPKSLTVHVPAHSLQQNSPSSNILQQVLTKAITAALSAQTVSSAAQILQDEINVAFNLIDKPKMS